MAQNFPVIGDASQSNAAAFNAAQLKVESVRSMSYGASAPTEKVVGQGWFNGTDLRIWDGTSWVFPNPSRQIQTITKTIDGTSDGVALFYAIASGTVTRVRLLPNDTIPNSGSDYYTTQLRNITTSVDLFATAPNTVGDGWAAGTPEDYTPDQNQSVAADNILRLTISGTGSPAALAELGVEITIQHS